MDFFHIVFFLHYFYSICFILFPSLGVQTVAGVPALCLAGGAVKVTGGVSSVSLDLSLALMLSGCY